MSFLTLRQSSSILILNSAFMLVMCFWYLKTFQRSWSRSLSTAWCSFFSFSQSPPSASPVRQVRISLVKCSLRSFATSSSSFTISSWFFSDSFRLLYFLYLVLNPQLQSQAESRRLTEPVRDLLRLPRMEPMLMSLRLRSQLLLKPEWLIFCWLRGPRRERLVLYSPQLTLWVTFDCSTRICPISSSSRWMLSFLFSSCTVMSCICTRSSFISRCSLLPPPTPLTRADRACPSRLNRFRCARLKNARLRYFAQWSWTVSTIRSRLQLFTNCDHPFSCPSAPCLRCRTTVSSLRAKSCLRWWTKLSTRLELQRAACRASLWKHCWVLYLSMRSSRVLRLLKALSCPFSCWCCTFRRLRAIHSATPLFFYAIATTRPTAWPTCRLRCWMEAKPSRRARLADRARRAMMSLCLR